MIADYEAWEAESDIPKDYIGNLMFGMLWRKLSAVVEKKKIPSSITAICMEMRWRFLQLQVWKGNGKFQICTNERQSIKISMQQQLWNARDQAF